MKVVIKEFCLLKVSGFTGGIQIHSGRKCGVFGERVDVAGVTVCKGGN